MNTPILRFLIAWALFGVFGACASQRSVVTLATQQYETRRPVELRAETNDSSGQTKVTLVVFGNNRQRLAEKTGIVLPGRPLIIYLDPAIVSGQKIFAAVRGQTEFPLKISFQSGPIQPNEVPPPPIQPDEKQIDDCIEIDVNGETIPQDPADCPEPDPPPPPPPSDPNG